MHAICSNCRYGVRFEQYVVCRRWPPLPVLIAGERHSPGDTLQGYWPRTGLDDTCGEHALGQRSKEDGG